MHTLYLKNGSIDLSLSVVWEPNVTQVLQNLNPAYQLHSLYLKNGSIDLFLSVVSEPNVTQRLWPLNPAYQLRTLYLINGSIDLSLSVVCEPNMTQRLWLLNPTYQLHTLYPNYCILSPKLDLIATIVGLAKNPIYYIYTVYRIWPYILWFPCQKCRLCTVYMYGSVYTPYICMVLFIHLIYVWFHLYTVYMYGVVYTPHICIMLFIHRIYI